jgi:DNA-binding Lrp family transcriptional regulator
MEGRLSHKQLQMRDITPTAVKTRINKMISRGIIQNFFVNINQAIFVF